MPETVDARRNLLRADCGNCSGLCCVALAFTRSADFAFSKDAGDPCVNLDEDFRCDIHPTLRERGMQGCTVFDCLGAGQRVSAAMGDWREGDANLTFAVFPVMRQLHELLWYLIEALGMPRAAALRDDLQHALDATEALASLPAAQLMQSDVAAHRVSVVDLVGRASALERAGFASLPKKIRPGADLIGASLAGLDLAGANLRGAYLIAADLTSTTFASADLIGADLRDARVHGADLSGALFLTQAQANAALGDGTTLLPVALVRPTHWG